MAVSKPVSGCVTFRIEVGVGECMVKSTGRGDRGDTSSNPRLSGSKNRLPPLRILVFFYYFKSLDNNILFFMINFFSWTCESWGYEFKPRFIWQQKPSPSSPYSGPFSFGA